MGWYKDEETAGPPSWLIGPMMWLSCAAAAVMPAVMSLAAWDLLFPDATLVAKLVVYLTWLAVMIAVLKPWGAR